MGTWGIARDMAKQNEENLSKLSRKGMYQKLKAFGSYSIKRIYKYKKATPQMLASIRSYHEKENKQIRRKKIILALAISVVLMSAMILGLFVIHF